MLRMPNSGDQTVYAREGLNAKHICPSFGLQTPTGYSVYPN